MGVPDRDFSLGAGGSEEVVVVPWPLLLRRRMVATVGRLSEPGGRLTASPRYRWWLLGTVLAGLFSVNYTFTVFAVSLPRVARGFHTSLNAMTWVITAPLLVFGVAAPTLGKAGDIWGHRRVYLWGLAGAAVCAALSAAAPGAGALIAARAASGIEGAATGAASMALIFQVFEPNDRVKAMGWWSLVGAGGPVIGVVIGGVAIERLGWRVLFVAQVPLILLALGLAVVVLPKTDRGKRSPGLDWAGAVTLTVAVVTALFGLNRGPEWGWTNPAVLGAFGLAPLASLAFVAVERRAPTPLLPLAFLRRRNFVLPIGAQVFSNFAYMGGFILAPLLLERVFGYRESHAGLLVIARPLAFSLTAPVAGYMAVRVGERACAVAGSSAVFASMLVFASLGTGSADLGVIAALALSGIGLGVASPSIAATVANAVDEASFGIASAAQQLMTQVGVVAGIQVLLTVQTARQAAVGLVGSFREAYLVGAGVCVLGIVCGALLRSARRAPAEVEHVGVLEVRTAATTR